MGVGAARRVLVGESDARLCEVGVVIRNASLVFSYEFLNSGHTLSDAASRFCTSNASADAFTSCYEAILHHCRSLVETRYGSSDCIVLSSALVGDQGELRVALFLVAERAAYEILLPCRAQTLAVARSFAEWRGLGGGDQDLQARQVAELHATLRGQWPCQGHDALPSSRNGSSAATGGGRGR
jgi:hypothetical protein